MRSRLNTEGENLTQTLFRERFDLTLEKITTPGNPDFFVYKNEQKTAVCEIKDVEDVKPSIETGWKKETEDSFWSRMDNTPSKIRKKIYDAEKQLSRHNLPKILVLVGFTGDGGDLHQAIIGSLSYVNKETGSVMEVFDKREGLERIRPILENIDLYIWINAKNKEFSFKWFDTTKGSYLLNTYFIPNPIRSV